MSVLGAATAARAAEPAPPDPQPAPPPSTAQGAGAPSGSGAPSGALGPAPTGAPAPQRAEPIEVVVTGTRTPESSQRATVRTRVVSREEAERRGATNVGEALDGELAVQVNPSAYGARGGVSALQIQGFDGERVLVLEDGERVIGDMDGSIDLSMIPLTDVSRIELVAGPTSSLYGTGAVGGVVNVLSAPPSAPGWSGRARVEGRSRLGLLVQGSGAYRHDDAWGAAEASFQREDGFALLEGRPEFTRPARSQRLIGLRAGAALGRGIELRLRGRWLEDAQDELETVTRPSAEGPKVYPIDVRSVTDRFTLQLGESIDLGGGSSLRLSAGRQWALRRRGQPFRDSVVGDTRERTGVLQSFEAIATLADGPTRTWVAGARVEVETLEQALTRVEAQPSSLDENEIDEVPYRKLGSGSLYGQLGWRLLEGLTVMPGVRGELHLDQGGIVAPRLAVAYSPIRGLTLRASGGRGFRAPSAKELGFSFDHSYLGYVVCGNPELVPEKSWGVNGDATLAAGEHVTLRAGAFANWIDDLIDISLEPVDLGDDLKGRCAAADDVDAYQYVNFGEAQTTGVDLSSTFRPAPWLRTEVGYAFLWTRGTLETEEGTTEQPLTGKPPHTLQASIVAQLPWKLELVARFRAVTSAFLEEGLRSTGFQTIDARLSRPLWPSSQAYVGVRNLLGAQKDPNRRGDQRPIEGRTVYLGIVAELPWEDL